MSGKSETWSDPTAWDWAGSRFLILLDRCVPAVSQALLDQAVDRLINHWGMTTEQIEVVTLMTPQTMLSYLAFLLERSPSLYAGALALGCLLETDDPEIFPVLAQEVAAGFMAISCRHRFPLANEILTLHDVSQAEERFCKGAEGVDAMMEMVSVCRSLQTA